MTAMRDDRRARETAGEIEAQAARIEQLTTQVAELTEQRNKALVLLRRTVEALMHSQGWHSWSINTMPQALREEIISFLERYR